MAALPLNAPDTTDAAVRLWDRVVRFQRRAQRAELRGKDCAAEAWRLMADCAWTQLVQIAGGDENLLGEVEAARRFREMVKRGCQR